MTTRPLTAAHRATRAKLLVVLPLTMALLVAATGFFTLNMTSRLYLFYGTDVVGSNMLAQLGVQIAAISLVAALLGFSIALGVTRPVRQVTEQLEALASGDFRGALSIASTKELDSLGGAFNDALSALQRYFFQSMTGAVITLDAEGRVIGSSPAAEATLGYREEDLVGRRFSDVFTPASGSRASLTAVETAISRRQPVSLEDLEILAADGRPVRIGISASYLQQSSGPAKAGRQDPKARSGEIVGVMIAFKDLNQMRSLQARLQQTDQLVALGTVTAGVAHEIRNPLASLRGLAELLGRDVGADETRRRYIKTMLDSIDRLNRLIEDLLLFSAPRPVDSEDVDVVDAVKATISLAQHGLGDRAVTLAIAASGRPLLIRGNRERLLQALTNIVLNATQATPDGGTVTVRAEPQNGQAFVSVHNTGSYIPPHVQRQLFVPFFTTKPTGTGLGLAIARQIVTSMDGRIDVDSGPDTGTTFVVELPLATAVAEKIEAALQT
ncbi:MAG: PAS domain-containing protein [Acidobacteria bacterium]|nr:PAS domain-containing protein [Acidobacteriota bacterium]